VTGAFDCQQFRLGGNHLQRLLQFCDGAEGIARAVDEQRRGAQAGQMLGALLLWFARRMQGIGKQQQGWDQVWLFCAEDAGLAPAVGMAGEEDRARDCFLNCCDGILQAGAVAGGVAGAGRAPVSHLPIGQIAAQDGESGGGESLGQGDEQRSLRVRARAMGEDEAVAVGRFRNMQEATDGFRAVLDKFADRRLGQEIIVNRGVANDG